MSKTRLKLEAGKSSTWRKIKAVELGLLSLKDVLKGNSVNCYTDSQNAVSIILKGGKVHELQSLALSIFEFCAKMTRRFIQYGYQENRIQTQIIQVES